MKRIAWKSFLFAAVASGLVQFGLATSVVTVKYAIDQAETLRRVDGFVVDIKFSVKGKTVLTEAMLSEAANDLLKSSKVPLVEEIHRDEVPLEIVINLDDNCLNESQSRYFIS